MAKRRKDEEELLSFSPRRGGNSFDDFDFLDDEEEEEVVEEQLVAEEPVVEEEPIVEEEIVAEEEPIIEEEPVVEEEPVEEIIDDELFEEVEEVAEEEAVEDFVEEAVVEDIEEEEEVLEEVDVDDIVEEDIFEEEPVEEPVVEEEPQDINVGIILDDEEDEGYDRTHIFDHAAVYYDQNTIILPRNFESRIRMASDDVKKLYSEIKNVLMEYSNVKSRMLKYVEVFRCGGAVAKMRIKGKSLYLYLKLDPSTIDQEYLKVVDKSERRGYEETPSEIKVTGKRKCKRSIEMIRIMMNALGVGHRRHPEVVDYAAKYPTPDNAVILGKNMIKVPRRSDYTK